MNESFIESRKAIANAREALKNGKMTEARKWAEHAAELAPQSEDPWLILAAVVSPKESVEYIRKALEANPNSPRAKKGMEWAMQKLGETPKPKAEISSDGGKQAQGEAPKRNVSKSRARSEDRKNPKKRSVILPILLIVVGCAVFIFAAWSAVTSPVFASILNLTSTPSVQAGPPFAQVNIAKPTVSAVQPLVQAAEPIMTFTAMPQTPATTEEAQTEVAAIQPTTGPTLEVTTLSTETPVIPSATAQLEVTSQPGVLYAEIVADTPTPEFSEPTVAPYVPPEVTGGDGVHWIDVDLSQQRLYAYAGDTLMNSFIVSTGTWQTPTVTGQYNIWIKLRSAAMSGPGYYLPDVPYVMYFYNSYGLHGTYWHNNFGTPMSHGCVNLTIPDAEWLYNFSSVGTLVNVHY
jgi:lipoprotein-anchoring transpeptidase ErfK/SrfK